jgi:hypothetical protein
MTDLPLVRAGDTIAAGEAYLADTPLLRAHAGTQPDLFLRWNAIPLAAAAVDVVVHIHGHSQEGRAMPLADKIMRSGLDLSRRRRPTLALVPRGNWFRHYYYDFPALLAGGLDRLVDHVLELFGRAMERTEPLRPDRLILAAHSGGGMPAVDMLAEAGRMPDEFFVFDGLYGRDPASGDPLRGIAAIERWLGERLAREPGRPGALRIVYIESQTGPFSRAVAGLVSRRLAALDPGLAPARRYRVESAIVQHSQIARHYMPALLARADADFDWPR